MPGPGGDPVTLQNRAVRVVDQGNLAGANPCSEGRHGLDRWCAFFKQKQTTTRGQDVWAVNLSRIGRGEDLRCDAPGPACVHVASGDHEVTWGFVADTLILDGIPAATGGMAATRTTIAVSAWRPEWDRAVAVTSAPASACWVDAVTEAVACVEQPHADAAAGALGTLSAGRLTAARRSLTVIPQGRDAVQASPSSDSLFVLLAPGLARLRLDSGTLEVLKNQVDGPFAVTPDEGWLLWVSGQKTGATTAAKSIVVSAVADGSASSTLLGDVLRYAFVDGPRRRGADVLAEVADSSGKSHLKLAGPDGAGAALTTDLGSWTGTTADRLDATSSDGYAVVADREGTTVVSLLDPGSSCLLGRNARSAADVALLPAQSAAFWIESAAGASSVGHRAALADCAGADVFASDVEHLQVEAGRHLLFIDSAKHLFQLDATVGGASPAAMRDQDEVVYRWAYDQPEDVLLLEMTSVFDTAVRLYALRHPF